ncbi:MAG: prohibitin family protein [Saprospirales bacterium]|jgi:regulator of protease activity HflC (stomatin/prohibitin superfamily)|nr:prohibitin family protein [Saprospirales bacterium]MBK8922456.1 prohibitin family protein [Saprospirales bacterium]
MFLAILGLFIAVISTTMSKANPNLGMFGKLGRYIGIALVALGVLTSCLVQISPGEVGVQTLFGKVQPGILTEGLNVVNPLVEVIHFDIRTQNYTMSGIHDEGEKMGDDAIRVLSADGLEVEIDITVLFRVMPDKAPEILRNIGKGYRDVIVRPLVRTKIRDFSAYYDAVALYSTKRDEFQQRLFAAIEKEFKDRGLVMEQVLVRNINLPASVKAAIEAKINAEQEAQKMKFVLDKERQEADRKRVEAQGIADYQRILTLSLTDKLLQYEQIKVQKELVASPNAKVIVLGSGKTTPLLIGQ